MGNLRLTLATSEYDHTRDLVTGVVPIEGVDPVWLQLQVEEVFHRFVRHREWDVSELSFAKYCALTSQGDRSLIAIPVFTSRVFRHSAMFVRADSGITTPSQLGGLRIGVPEWVQTAAVWGRGILQHQYGVDLHKVDWFQGGVSHAGRQEKVAVKLPEGMRLTRMTDRSLNDLLLEGEIDAILSARPPIASAAGDGRIVRVLADARAEEEAYVAQTGVFPIMHTVVIRRDVADAYPWLPQSLFKAFSQARDISIARWRDGAVSRFPVPWHVSFAHESWRKVGQEENPWPYGIEANLTTIDTFLQYCFEQGVCEKRLSPTDLFAPQVDAGYRD